MRRALVLAVLCWTALGAEVVRVVDGDTLVLRLLTYDAGARVWVEAPARLLGVDAPELHGSTRAAGEAARDFTARWVAAGPVAAHVCGADKYGRPLVRLERGGESLADALIAAGHAVRR